MNQFVKQAQALQANMQKAQAEIASLEVTGESGGGMVKVVMTGRHEVKRVQIEPSIIGEDREMLEDLVAAAINDAVHRLGGGPPGQSAAAVGGPCVPPGREL